VQGVSEGEANDHPGEEKEKQAEGEKGSKGVPRTQRDLMRGMCASISSGKGMKLTSQPQGKEGILKKGWSGKVFTGKKGFRKEEKKICPPSKWTKIGGKDVEEKNEWGETFDSKGRLVLVP